MLALPAVVQAEKLPVKRYTTADGLAHDRVKRIVRDSHGFLWFCTADGLSRFNGYRFLTFTTAHGLPDATVNDLLETRSGVYWIATDGGGVCRFNPSPGAKPAPATAPNQSSRKGDQEARQRFAVYPVGEMTATNSVNVLYEDRAGHLWVGTDAGLFCMDETGARRSFRRVNLGLTSLPDQQVHVWSLAEDREGTLWLGTSSGLMRRVPDGRVAHYPIRPSQGVDHVWGLLTDREGKIWVGHDAALIVTQPEPASVVTAGEHPSLQLENHFLSASASNGPVRLPSTPGESRRYTQDDGLVGNSMGPLFHSSDGRTWIGNSGGLSVFDGRYFRSYTAAQGLSESNVISLAEDRDGNIWAGTSASGAIKIARHGLVSYSKADGLGHNYISSIMEDAAGGLYAISGYWFISRLDERRFVTVRPSLSLNIAPSSWQSYQATIRDHTGEWWIATGAGLYRYPGAKNLEELAESHPLAVYTTMDGLAGNDVSCLFEDSRGDIWIGKRYAGQEMLTRWERNTGTFHRHSASQGLPPFNSPASFCEDGAGNLWIGFTEGGLACHRKGRFSLLTRSDGIPEGKMQRLYLDRARRLWIASSRGGAARIEDPAADRPSVVTYTTAQGLASNNVSCITEDRWGRVYIGSTRGIDRLDQATGRIKHYGVSDGLANNEVFVSFHDRNGTLWFGTRQGLSRLNPERDQPRSPPPVLIDEIRIEGVPFPVSSLGESAVSQIELAPQQNHVQIDFFGLSFAAGELLRYQFMLEGEDRDWGALTDQRSVYYAGLSPGKYRFLVRAVSADGTTNTSPAQVSFRILPPFWQRWWFVSLAAIFATAMIFGAHHYRVARLVELERIRTRIATDLHDDIGASLSQIAILSEVARHQLGGDRAPVEESLSVIAGGSRELVDSMSDIVWAIDPNRDRLGDLTQRMRRFASDTFTARNIAFRFDAPAEERNLDLGVDVRRQVYLIFKESVNNVVRHSCCTEADVELAVEGDLLLLKVADNGKGFEQERPSDGHGLPSLQERAKNLGGTLEVTSKRGQGTTVILRVPIVSRRPATWRRFLPK